MGAIGVKNGGFSRVVWVDRGRFAGARLSLSLFLLTSIVIRECFDGARFFLNLYIFNYKDFSWMISRL